MNLSLCMRGTEGWPGLRMLRAVLVGGVLVGALALGVQAEATITVQFTGSVIGPLDPANPTPGSPLQPPYDELFVLGEAVTGSYTFDPDTPDSEPANANLGVYAAESFSIVFAGGFSAVNAADAAMNITVNSEGGFGTDYIVDVSGLATPLLADLVLEQVSLFLDDEENTAIASDALPLALDLADFELAVIALSFADPVNPSDFRAVGVELDTLTFIPEPATAALLGLGGLVVLRRRG